jgi:DeoR/GlpR family transcriptional regulator of sugar metabolism
MNTPARAGVSQRQEDLGRYILEHGTVSITELATAFEVSAMTVHRDLDELDRQGLVRRFRGGASAQPSNIFESNVRYRLAAMQQEKAAIAENCRTLIEPGMSILLDEGTTALAIARLLGDISPLTVVTNYRGTINVLCEMRNVHLIVLGGDYRPNHDSFVGLQCLDSLQSLRTDLAFLSTSAVSDDQAYHQVQEVVQVKHAMMRASSRSILVVDHSKLGAVALHRFAPIADFDAIVTDDGADAAHLERLADHARELRVAALNNRGGEKDD